MDTPAEENVGRTPNTDRIDVTDNPDKSRFEAHSGGDSGVRLAVLDYRRAGGKLFLVHTQVARSAQGRGVGSTLVKEVLEKARAEGLPVVPRCPFVHSYIKRHPEYQSLVMR